MKIINKIAIVILAMASLTWACRKIEVGYLSDYIKYQNPTLYLMPGTNTVTGPLMEDGSTMPLHVEMVEIRNSETGEVATDLLTERPVTTWKEVYDWEVDTTMAQLEKKLEITDQPAFKLNEVSGQMTWNTNTMYAEGTNYEFDLKISNVRGSKIYENIGQVELLPLESVTWNGQTRLQIKQIGADGKTTTVYSKFENMDDLINGTSVAHQVNKLSDEGAPGIIVHLRTVDKNDVPFNPADGEVLGSWPGYNLPHLANASVDTEVLDDEIIYKFPVLPFPYAGALWYNKNPFMYYYIPDKAIGVVDSEELSSPYDPALSYWLNFRIRIFINEPGEWEIVIKYHNVSHS